jgi:hypothetical protein
LPNSSDVLRFRRGERYNIADPSLPELGDSSEPILMDLPLTHFKRDPMPFNLSEVIAVATIKSGQSYFSNDRRNIYSEFRATLDEIFKAPNSLNLRVGDSIDIQREGGVITLQSGKVLVRGKLAASMPTAGGRYLIFLKYNPQTEDFLIETGYQLQDARVYRLDDQRNEESTHDTIRHPLRAEAESADVFLARVRAKEQAPHQKGGRQ